MIDAIVGIVILFHRVVASIAEKQEDGDGVEVEG